MVLIREIILAKCDFNLKEKSSFIAPNSVVIDCSIPLITTNIR